MNVLMISPGFPVEQPHFTSALARQGANVIGLGDQPQHALNVQAKQALAAYLQVGSFSDEPAIIKQVCEFAKQVRIDQVECTWEPFMTLAAKLRHALGIAGMSLEQTILFRDKELMKQALDKAGVRTPYHVSSTSIDGVRQAVDKIGYPVCIKPIAGAGSADTYRVDDEKRLEQILPLLGHVQEVSVEEFIEGEEFTFDTICIDGEIKFFNICMYRPRPLTARTEEWISPQTIALKNVDDPYLAPGIELGRSVIKALGFQTGFTHMEWFLKPDHEAVFGEIAARPPGANTVDLMNFANDISCYDAWAEAVLKKTFNRTIERKYNAAHIFKRAQGQGIIREISGLEGLLAEYGEHFCVVDLLPIGTQRRNWKQTLRSDGMIIMRHPDFKTICEMADQVGTRLQMYAS